jgi:site-specific recombinase XerD
LENNKDKGGYLFPRPQTKTGHIFPEYVWNFIKLMDLEQPIWSHLFQHSLATELASNEVSPFEMKAWFDWENISTADEYVEAVGISTKKVSSRVW